MNGVLEGAGPAASAVAGATLHRVATLQQMLPVAQIWRTGVW